ncbi:hypothetical protein [Methylosinus sp. Sm6]|uniref:hypothetical protein n=1 Tax=Methylosinus sp. Sm6 TaxID=2866948 RepID=UPI001C990313|nr:hypothetical protein [Methylosinus sp. Sm6]MBY6244141.1 hypothetical protein [Methylosinus sp. Sm6]
MSSLEELSYQIAELRRMISNLVRPGVVKSYDGAKHQAVLDLGFETHPIDVGAHGGTGADFAPLKAGQQIMALCPEGDIGNAMVIAGGFHDGNKAPSQAADEDIRAQRGSGDKAVRLRTTDHAAILEAEDASVTVEGGKVTITADRIILSGTVYLGGADASKPAAMEGTIDTRGDADVSNLATKVFVK